jgi:cytochrome b561
MIESIQSKQRKLVSRYHPLLVTLHWLLAMLIIAALTVGFFELAAMPNSDPKKLDVLELHMAGGMLILALTIIRFIVRVRSAKPAPLSTGYPLLDRLASITHYGFYLLIVAMVGTGYATGIIAGLPESVFARSGAPLPPDFQIYPTRIAHGYLAALLVGFIALHVLAALYHQFIKKDQLLRRILFGSRAFRSTVSADTLGEIQRHNDFDK